MKYINSKLVCPKCKNQAVRRVHRGFIRKHIFRMKPIYVCSYCDSNMELTLVSKPPVPH